MRASTIVMIGFAVVFGLLAVFIAQIWLSNQAKMQVKREPEKQLATQTIVVAKQPLRFGTEISAAMLQEVPWPADAVPAGAFNTINSLLGGGRRVVLAAIEQHEPVLALKVTGAGQRATLSALVKPGMKAVTIRVNDVEGVGGFVLPGDHVDIALTRTIDKGDATTEVVLQNTRVLAIDQVADERAAKATVAKSVTLEVTTLNAQKLWLASSVGSLSLLLRKAGETTEMKTTKVTLKDLGNGGARGPTATVSVTRAGAKQQYTVPTEEAVTDLERRQASY
ncbi:Flp pilus assembly protein CpaB [Microbacteriaceae bacterium K1510]|nr:Flp pilus assembly protein CpaB [Microbacteriaceae bacterium K1510]